MTVQSVVYYSTRTVLLNVIVKHYTIFYLSTIAISLCTGVYSLSNRPP